MTSGIGKGICDLLYATAIPPNLTMKVKGKTQMMTSSMPQEEGGRDDSSLRFNKHGVT